MNEAEKKRDARIAGWSDRQLVDYILAADHDDAVTEIEFAAFEDMSKRLSMFKLTRRQRQWAEDVARRITPIDSRDVLRVAGHGARL